MVWASPQTKIFEDEVLSYIPTLSCRRLRFGSSGIPDAPPTPSSPLSRSHRPAASPTRLWKGLKHRTRLEYKYKRPANHERNTETMVTNISPSTPNMCRRVTQTGFAVLHAFQLATSIASTYMCAKEIHTARTNTRWEDTSSSASS